MSCPSHGLTFWAGTHCTRCVTQAAPPSVVDLQASIVHLKSEIERYEKLKQNDEAWGMLHRTRAAFIERGHYLYFAVEAAVKKLSPDSTGLPDVGGARELLKEALAELAGKGLDDMWRDPPPAPAADYALDDQHKNMHIYNPSIRQSSYWREKVNGMMYRAHPELKR